MVEYGTLITKTKPNQSPKPPVKTNKTQNKPQELVMSISSFKPAKLFHIIISTFCSAIRKMDTKAKIKKWNKQYAAQFKAQTKMEKKPQTKPKTNKPDAKYRPPPPSYMVTFTFSKFKVCI